MELLGKEPSLCSGTGARGFFPKVRWFSNLSQALAPLTVAWNLLGDCALPSALEPSALPATLVINSAFGSAVSVP